MEIKHAKIIKKGNNPTDIKVLVSINPGSFTEFDVLKGQETEVEYLAYGQYVKINKGSAGYNEAIKEGIELLDPSLIWIGSFQEKIEGSSEFKDKFYALPMSVKGTEAKTDSQEVKYQTKEISHEKISKWLAANGYEVENSREYTYTKDGNVYHIDQLIHLISAEKVSNQDLEMNDELYDKMQAMATERNETSVLSFLSGCECMLDYIKSNFTLTKK